MGFEIDISGLKLDLIKKVIYGGAEKGMNLVGLQIINDAVMEEPYCPLDEGTLRASGSWFVNNKYKGDSRHLSPHPEKGTPYTEFKIPLEKGDLITLVGFNTPYAARTHEDPNIKNWSEPGSGNKWLESKLTKFKSQYAEIIGKQISNALK